MNLNRREFIKVSMATGAGLVLGFQLPGGSQSASIANAADSVAEFVPNVYLRVDTTGTVTILVHRSEMGQGVQTAFPMIIAEELNADWSQIRIEQAPADFAYGHQVTGGSTSIQESYDVLRSAGAVAHDMLLTAAAQIWDVEKEKCYCESGVVFHQNSDQQLGYGELVEVAATLPVPRARDVAYKNRADFSIIGTRKGQFDEPRFVTGQAVYGSDIQFPDLLVAVVARCPVFGGEVADFDAIDALAVDGVRHVTAISTGVAVVAESTWAAIKGRDALEITWDEGPNAELNTETIRQELRDRVQGSADHNVGMTSEATTVIEAIYSCPYQAHATMEPMTGVADVREDKTTVWAPTQNRQRAAQQAQIISSEWNNFDLHVPLLGGGFGRRLEVDYVEEAVEISQAIGVPVKLFWSREDDMQHDFYHAGSFHFMRAGLDTNNNFLTWEHHVGAAFSDPRHGIDIPYRFPGITVRASIPRIGIPVGAWRAVFNIPNAFANECFFDELAEAADLDPYEARLALLPDDSPLRTVLQTAATAAGWGEPLPDGWGRGIACHSTWNVSHVAQVAEVSVDSDNQVRVHRVVCAVDCGIAINPDAVEAQMEGGIVFALSAALHGEITFQNGRVQESNFHDYPLLRFDKMPVVEVHIIPSDNPPTGIGEMSGPPIAPAVANAVYAASGKRVRRLPIRLDEP